MPGRLHRYLHRRLLRRLATAETGLEAQSPGAVLATAQRARQLAQAADKLARRAEAEVRRSTCDAALPEMPARTNWSARAPIWDGGGKDAGVVPEGLALGGGATVHHDGEADRLSLRSLTVPGAGQGLVLDVLDFSGSYLSVSLPFPEAALAGLGRQSLLRAAMVLRMDRPLTCYTRLNLRNGPNTCQMVRGFDTERGQEAVEFDLFYADVEPEGASDLWLDLIFENPAMVQIEIADAIFSRRPRAGI